MRTSLQLQLPIIQEEGKLKVDSHPHTQSNVGERRDVGKKVYPRLISGCLSPTVGLNHTLTPKVFLIVFMLDSRIYKLPSSLCDLCK